ncbi:hypothetical protein [Bacteroides acidifaciens]|uniref:hypothetical protein n=1 Tax=Bacteroides acidifaciens TaxID=85831 RepID=UPI003F69386E
MDVPKREDTNIADYVNQRATLIYKESFRPLLSSLQSSPEKRGKTHLYSQEVSSNEPGRL